MNYKEDIIWIALADKTRRDIMDMIYKKEQLSAGEISDKFDMTKPSISRHLNILKQAGIIDATRQGKNIMYSMNDSWGENILAFTDRLHNREKPIKVKENL